MDLKAKLLTILPFLLLAIGVPMILFGLLTQAEAESAPNRIVLRIQQSIKENQEIITETRDAHIQFMTAKEDNNYQVRKLKELCYDLDWSSLAIAKVDNCTPEVLE
jgi:hypothetical protein